MLTNQQQELLIKIGMYQQMGDGADFTLVRLANSAELRYPNGVSVECVGNDDDFHQLQQTRVITLSRNENGELVGRLTERGKLTVFGAPTGKFHGYELQLNYVPKDTRAYEIFSEVTTLAMESHAFHSAEAMQNMPPASASDDVWLDFALKTIAGKYDIQVQLFLKSSKLTYDAHTAFEKLLDELRNTYVLEFSKQQVGFIKPAMWPSEVNRCIEARNQYWIGVHLRQIRERREYLNSLASQPEQANGKNFDPREATQDESHSALATPPIAAAEHKFEKLPTGTTSDTPEKPEVGTPNPGSQTRISRRVSRLFLHGPNQDPSPTMSSQHKLRKSWAGLQ